MLDPSEIDDESELRPLDRDQYRKLGELGYWEDERVELLEGVVVKMSPIGLPHTRFHALLTTWLARALPRDLLVSAGGPYVASRISEPVPDIAVVREEVLRVELPKDALLIIEVSDSSLRKDRGVKARIYAGAGVRDYWVVNVKEETIEVFRDPERRRYRTITRHDRFAKVQPLLLPDIVVCLDDLLK